MQEVYCIRNTSQRPEDWAAAIFFACNANDKHHNQLSAPPGRACRA